MWNLLGIGSIPGGVMKGLIEEIAIHSEALPVSIQQEVLDLKRIN